MDDRRKRHKSKSSRRHDHRRHDRYDRRDRHHSSSTRDRSHYIRDNSEESKTPPLPSISNDANIDDLIKTRETLKHELRRITSQPDVIIIDSKSKDSNTRKRQSSDMNTEKGRPASKKDKTNEARTPVDSDEEEKIIEQRRQQRKLLLEKLNVKDTPQVIEIDGDNDSVKASNANNHKIDSAMSNDSKRSNNNTNDTKPQVEINNDKVHDPDTCETKNTTNVTASKANHEETKLTVKMAIGDMFSEKDDFHVGNNSSGQLVELTKANIVDNFDDEEGYFKARVGDTLYEDRFVIKSILGQGMFANVIKAHDKARNFEVAIKIARNNDMMYKNAQKEVAVLNEVNSADPDDRAHCVRFLRHFMHKGHLCIVLESLSMDLRNIVRKYGKNCGLSMQAVISYSKQLLVALRHLKKVGYIHADIKPDNILVNESKTVLKLCDFGSAEKVNVNEMRPYLVSRFYRAPEIILGVPFGFGIDVWSAACTIYELATGKIMFTGNSNNKMLKYFMDVKGKIPNKLLKKGKFKDQHFNYNNNFLLQCVDPATNREKVVELVNVTATRQILQELKQAHTNISNYEEKRLVLLKDLLDKMLTLDPSHRMTASECLRHPFIQEGYKK